MKVCVFSDVHGNGPAFRKAFSLILSEKADLNIFLGDLCGYYFDQQQIFEMILSVPNLIALQGNHDRIFLEILQGDEVLRRDYLRKYGLSLEYLLEDDDQELIQWLSALEESCSFPDLGLMGYHGSPWDPTDGYVYPDTSLGRFLEYSSSLFILGHTHYPMVRTIGEKLIVNPGSLGQPRGGGWPTYAIIDLEGRRTEFREVAYDRSELIKRIDELDSRNRYLKEVLLR